VDHHVALEEKKRLFWRIVSHECGILRIADQILDQAVGCNELLGGLKMTKSNVEMR